MGIWKLKLYLEASSESQNNQFIRWELNDQGQRTGYEGWLSADNVVKQGWETLFELDLNKDEIIGSPVQDTNNDGLVDGANHYQLYSNAEAIDITVAGKTFSDSYSSEWNITKVVHKNGRWNALLEGTNSQNNQLLLKPSCYPFSYQISDDVILLSGGCDNNAKADSCFFNFKTNTIS